VIEGAGDCCEYMTGGVIVTVRRSQCRSWDDGGLAYFLDEDGKFPELVNQEIVKLQRE